MSITVKYKELLAMSLGDGYINKAGYLVFRHCLAQEEYLRWKYSIIKKFCDVEPYYHKNNEYGAYEARTRVCKPIKHLRKILYPKGKKRITPKLLKKAGVFGLLILYLDDGSLYPRKKNGKITAYELVISLYVSEKEAQDLIDYIYTQYNVKFRVKRNKGKCSLVCGTLEARKFLALLQPLNPNLECFRETKFRDISKKSYRKHIKLSE